MLLGSMAQNAFAQKIEIKGTVRDASDYNRQNEMRAV